MAATNNAQPPTPSNTTAELAMFGPHVVALIDLLGQTHALEKWDHLPSAVTRDHPWVQAVRDSVGIVEFWRNEFQLRLTEFQGTQDELIERVSAGTPEEQRRLHEQYRKSQLHDAHFSDTLIFYSPLQNEFGFWQMTNLIKLIVASGALLLAGLNSKRVFRGAIEVGMLTRLQSGDPYGPALARAHHLESKVADYPRIVVGPGILSYLDAIDRTEGTDPPIQAIKALAGTCRTFLAQDSKGCWFVDYLNDAFANGGGDQASWQNLRATALPFVEAELIRFRMAGDEELTGRYTRLRDYFASRGNPSKASVRCV